MSMGEHHCSPTDKRRKIMKKIILISVILILLVAAFAGCKKNDQQPDNNDATQSHGEISEEEHVDIGVPSTAKGGESEKMQFKSDDASETPEIRNNDMTNDD